MNTVFLSLGGNIGDKKNNVNTALSEIERSVGAVIQKSALYETEPWGFQHENLFLNQVVKIVTKKSAEEVLEAILSIEQLMGRVRKNANYDARTIDIDILFFNNDIINTNHLSIPHPRIQERKFVLIPLNEIASEIIHPSLKKTVNVLMSECTDVLKVKKLS